MKQLLLTGAGGVVGSALTARFLPRHPGVALVDLAFPRGTPAGARTIHCDLQSPSAVQRLLDEVNPDVILHLAGNKDVFALEHSPEQARRANVETTANLVRALAGRETFFVYLSTDYVFEGTAGPYPETAPPHPTTEYGRSKLAAEECLGESGLPVAIARSAAVFGYPGDFVSVVTASLRAGKPFGAFFDLVSTPTFVDDLAEMLTRLIDRRLQGIFHLCGRDSSSREAFARLIARTFDLDPGLIRREVRTERVRPSDVSLDGTATWAALGYAPDSLSAILQRLRRGEPPAPISS